MNFFRAIVLVTSFVAAPTVVLADPAPSEHPLDPATAHGRLVPVMRDGAFIGLKVYAIKAGGRFDQPTAKFQNGDTILAVDGEAVTTDAGTRALHDKVLLGKADATVSLQRAGKAMTLQSKAVH